MANLVDGTAAIAMNPQIILADWSESNYNYFLNPFPILDKGFIFGIFMFVLTFSS